MDLEAFDLGWSDGHYRARDDACDAGAVAFMRGNPSRLEMEIAEAGGDLGVNVALTDAYLRGFRAGCKAGIVRDSKIAFAKQCASEFPCEKEPIAQASEDIQGAAPVPENENPEWYHSGLKDGQAWARGHTEGAAKEATSRAARLFSVPQLDERKGYLKGFAAGYGATMEKAFEIIFNLAAEVDI